jgi:hypothetical protein
LNAGRNKLLTASIGKPAGIITVLISLIVITPLCGLLFSCGCTWPGAGLEENCNYFDRSAHYQCPWCTSIIAGGLSVGFALFAGYFASMANWFSLQSPSPAFKQVFVRVIGGLGVFFLAAFVAGLVSAKIQGYPVFL